MLGLVARLHDKHPKFILLRASDAVDQLFLTRYLRQNYPEARVVVTAPDLLYAREDDGLLHGVLGISGLAGSAGEPLSVPSRKKRPGTASFSASVSGEFGPGEYNAMVSVLLLSVRHRLVAMLCLHLRIRTELFAARALFRLWQL